MIRTVYVQSSGFKVLSFSNTYSISAPRIEEYEVIKETNMTFVVAAEGSKKVLKKSDVFISLQDLKKSLEAQKIEFIKEIDAVIDSLNSVVKEMQEFKEEQIYCHIFKIHPNPIVV